MPVVRPCLAVACLLVCGFPASAADTKPPPGQVMHVPPEEAIAILGTPVTGPDGKTIGHLVDVLVDAAGEPEAGVIDVGGFMGVGTRKIAVHWSALHFTPVDRARPITLDLTLDQIKAAPEYVNPTKSAPVVLPVHESTAPIVALPSASREQSKGNGALGSASQSPTTPVVNKGAAATTAPGAASSSVPNIRAPNPAAPDAGAPTPGASTPGADNPAASAPGMQAPAEHGSKAVPARAGRTDASGDGASAGAAPGSPASMTSGPVQTPSASAGQPAAKDAATGDKPTPTTQ